MFSERPISDWLPITKKEVFVDSELPDDFSSVLEKWKTYIDHLD